VVLQVIRVVFLQLLPPAALPEEIVVEQVVAEDLEEVLVMVLPEVD